MSALPRTGVAIDTYHVWTPGDEVLRTCIERFNTVC
jgi:hypothetical protein